MAAADRFRFLTKTANRHMESSPSSHWARMTEAGNYAGLVFIYWIFRCLGRRVFRVVLFPVVAYFYIARGEARRASREYLEHLYQSSPGVLSSPPGLMTSFRHFQQFGEAALDKAIAWSGKLPGGCIDIVDEPAYRTVFDDTRGRLIIGSHLGNLEFCRGFASQHREVLVNALVYDQHAINFNRVISRLNPKSRVKLLQVTELNIPTMLSLKQKIDNGEWVVITGDRTPVIGGVRRTVQAEFLGAPAPFPIGPYILASTLQCPVSLLFAYRQGSRLKANFEIFSDRIVLDRAQRDAQIRKWAQKFADRLAENCRAAPLQWFNFYPFWDPKID